MKEIYRGKGTYLEMENGVQKKVCGYRKENIEDRNLYRAGNWGTNESQGLQ